MKLTTNSDRSIASPRITHLAVTLAVAATLAVGSASFVAMSLGDPELMALVALAGLVTVLLALALSRAGVAGNRSRSPTPPSRADASAGA